MNACTHTQDAILQGAALSDADRTHLESCQTCAEFAEILDATPPLTLVEPSAVIDQQLRHAAATVQLTRRRSRQVLWVIAAACLTFGMVLIQLRVSRAPSENPEWKVAIELPQPAPSVDADSASEITEESIAAALNWDDDMDDALLSLDAELAFDQDAEFYATLAALE
ncbi:MAG: hypothetical protein ACI8W8_001388 [Rhodothermales bacterium]|jgi:hypothetical protein